MRRGPLPLLPDDSRPMTMQGSTLLLLIAPALLGAGLQRVDGRAAADRSAADPSAAPEAQPEDPMPDLPADAFRLELLELAFEAASAIPVEPQIKERSQSQEEVVLA